jgi:hypothetical protein
LFGKYPFHGKNNEATLQKIINGKFIIPSGTNLKFVYILKKMLNSNPIVRPSVSEVIAFLKK